MRRLAIVVLVVVLVVSCGRGPAPCRPVQQDNGTGSPKHCEARR